MSDVRTANPLVLVALLLFTPVAQATNFDVSHLAAELNRVSAELARDLRSVRGYSSVRFSADRLSKEAAQLVNAISRNRSLSYQRSRFQNVVRRYRELEEAFLRSNREHDRYVYNQVGVISNLFSGLNSEFFYTNYVEPAPQYYYTPPALRRLPGGVGRRSLGGFSQQVPNTPQRTDRRNTGTIRALVPANNFSHRSPVLERQQRNAAQFSRPLDVGSSRSGSLQLP
ncbi:MAG: hypothetical protein MI746_11815 [Pseudomonadales bacterium]|nr:hypothetical protein [Pseudomonadales bacterium]